MFCVRVDHLSDQDLAVLGYTLVDEDSDFKMYRCYDGTEHIVDKNGKKYLYVDDVNDALAMQSEEILQFAQPKGRGA